MIRRADDDPAGRRSVGISCLVRYSGGVICRLLCRILSILAWERMRISAGAKPRAPGLYACTLRASRSKMVRWYRGGMAEETNSAQDCRYSCARPRRLRRRRAYAAAAATAAAAARLSDCRAVDHGAAIVCEHSLRRRTNPARHLRHDCKHNHARHTLDAARTRRAARHERAATVVHAPRAPALTVSSGYPPTRCAPPTCGARASLHSSKLPG